MAQLLNTHLRTTHRRQWKNNGVDLSRIWEAIDVFVIVVNKDGHLMRGKQTVNSFAHAVEDYSQEVVKKKQREFIQDLGSYCCFCHYCQ